MKNVNKFRSEASGNMAKRKNGVKREIHDDGQVITLVIITTNRQRFVVRYDSADRDVIDPEKVFITGDPNRNRPYASMKIGYKPNGWPDGQRLHRYLMDCPKGMVVDHINNDPLDNRRSNLEVVTTGENNRRAVALRKLIVEAA